MLAVYIILFCGKEKQGSEKLFVERNLASRWSGQEEKEEFCGPKVHIPYFPVPGMELRAFVYVSHWAPSVASTSHISTQS